MVTLIITNYNKGCLLRRAVESALKQTYKELEIIVIDDDSSDNPLEILNDISDSRLTIYKNTKNCGTYGCRNFAIDHSSGEYITFLDADDYLDQRHIELLIKEAVDKNYKAVNCKYQRFDETGKRVEAGLCEPGILLHRSIIKDIGYFHMVKMGADSEYRERIKKFYKHIGKIPGKTNHITYFAVKLKNSLTTNPDTGGRSKARRHYVSRWCRDKRTYYHYSESMEFLNLLPESLTIPLDFSNFKKIK